MLAALAWAALSAWGALAATPAGAAPALTIDPDRGPCDTKAMVRGTGFAPGQPIRLSAGTASGTSGGIELRTPPVDADGTFAREVEVALIAGPCDPRFARPAGTQVVFYVEADTRTDSARDALLATAVFTVTTSPSASPSPAPPMPGLPNTGAGDPAAGHPWSPAWGLGLTLLLAALGGAYITRLRIQRRG